MDITWATNQEAVYRELLGEDGWGSPSYGPEVGLKVRWQFQQKLVRAPNGKEVMSEAEVWVPLDVSPKPGDLFVYQDNSYEVINTGEKVSIYGEPSHHKVFCISKVTE